MIMRIQCDYCGQPWELYRRDNLIDERMRYCPHCNAKIKKMTWINKVVPAFVAADRANMALYADHAQGHLPLFTVAFIPDHIFPVQTVEDVLTEYDIKPNLD